MLISFHKTLFTRRFRRKLRQNLSIEKTPALFFFSRSLITFFILIALHVLAMMKLEDMSFQQAVWLTMTTASTVGYGDLSAQTLLGQIATIVLLYFGGIAALGHLATMFFDYQFEVRTRKLRGNWHWKMKDHIVFLNSPADEEIDFFYNSISNLRNSHSVLAKTPIVIVSDRIKSSLPDQIRQLNVVHVSKPVSSNTALESASIQSAKIIIIISRDQYDPISDSINFELVDRLRTMGVPARIIVEAVKDTNRDRLKKAGADNVLRPMRAYPELLARTIVAPGTEQVIETLFNPYNEECVRYDINLSMTWSEVIIRLVNADLGIPIAYESKDGKIINNPSSVSKINAQAIFVIVNHGHYLETKKVKEILTKRVS